MNQEVVEFFKTNLLKVYGIILNSIDLQNLYDGALLVSRKVYKTSSGTKALCLSLGLTLSKQELQAIRIFLFQSGVTLKVGDRQCVDPLTKQKKSKQQKKIRSLETSNQRVLKMRKSRWGKSKEELDKIQTKQKNHLQETLNIKMADKETWQIFQDQCQHKSSLAKSKMTLEDQDDAITKWKKKYWSKSDDERYLIQSKKEKSSKIGFWLDGIWFGSSFELNMFQFLTKLNVNFIYHGFPCDLNGYTWHPDFYLPDHNVILEVKGAYPKSKTYWLEKTLPKIRESKLGAKYTIRVYWERKIKVSTLPELLELCEVIQ